ncbi:hypothetical protein NECAME_02433 [Necator americanus]|uniref:Uncharacterized protein n=1 Tax=Necator americanus TaxID=51031 RepID=W2TGL0_NECAM|nr:hypothetical protein NECAME_02433 [Necator americanus]ETN80301.1 hypothetical protein NECAME_02433 [Necator americanus]
MHTLQADVKYWIAEGAEEKIMTESGDFEKRIREERIRYEQAKHLHEEQRRFEQQQKSDNDRGLREELKRRSEEMKKRLEELKTAELRRQFLLEKRQREEEERLRKIAEKQEEEKFEEMTSTDLSTSESITKKIRYRLRPSQTLRIIDVGAGERNRRTPHHNGMDVDMTALASGTFGFLLTRLLIYDLGRS